MLRISSDETGRARFARASMDVIAGLLETLAR